MIFIGVQPHPIGAQRSAARTIPTVIDFLKMQDLSNPLAGLVNRSS
jgi:hypothetical protein